MTSNKNRARVLALFHSLLPGTELGTADVYQSLGVNVKKKRDVSYNALQYFWHTGVLVRRMVLGKARWRLAVRTGGIHGIHGMKEQSA